MSHWSGETQLAEITVFCSAQFLQWRLCDIQGMVYMRIINSIDVLSSAGFFLFSFLFFSASLVAYRQWTTRLSWLQRPAGLEVLVNIFINCSGYKLTKWPFPCPPLLFHFPRFAFSTPPRPLPLPSLSLTSSRRAGISRPLSLPLLALSLPRLSLLPIPALSLPVPFFAFPQLPLPSSPARPSLLPGPSP